MKNNQNIHSIGGKARAKNRPEDLKAAQIRGGKSRANQTDMKKLGSLGGKSTQENKHYAYWIKGYYYFFEIELCICTLPEKGKADFILGPFNAPKKYIPGKMEIIKQIKSHILREYGREVKIKWRK